MNTKEWLIKLENKAITWFDHDFLVSHPILDEQEQLMNYDYSVIDLQGDYLYDHAEGGALPEEYQLYLE